MGRDGQGADDLQDGNEQETNGDGIGPAEGEADGGHGDNGVPELKEGI